METDRDHIHILIQYPPTQSVSGIAKMLKQESTWQVYRIHRKQLRKYYWYQDTLWSKGYFYCSIGDVFTDIIQKYIRNQG